MLPERLLSGASAAPTRTLHRLRARMTLRKRLTLSATAAGGLPASTISKCRRARLSSSLRKKARASSSRTRTREGFATSILRNAAIALSSSSSRRSSSVCRAACRMAVAPSSNSALMSCAEAGRANKRIRARQTTRMRILLASGGPSPPDIPAMDRAGGLAAGERRQYSPYRIAERKRGGGFRRRPGSRSVRRGRGEAPPRPDSATACSRRRLRPCGRPRLRSRRRTPSRTSR